MHVYSNSQQLAEGKTEMEVKHNSNGKQKQPSNAVVMYSEKEIQLITTALSNLWISPENDSKQGLSLAPFIFTVFLSPLQTQCLLAAGDIHYGVSLIKIFSHLQHDAGLGRLQHRHFNLIVLNWTA